MKNATTTFFININMNIGVESIIQDASHAMYRCPRSADDT